MGYLAECVSRQHLDSNGMPYSGGKIYCYRHNSAGTKELLDIYSDRDLTNSKSNPVTLDARGSTKIFWDGTPARFELWYDDQLIESWVNIVGGNGSSSSGGVTNITSQDGSLDVTTTTTSYSKTVDLKIKNNTVEYGMFHGTNFSNLQIDSGSMTLTTDGAIACSANTLYHFMVDISFNVASTGIADAMGAALLSINNSLKVKLTRIFDASVTDEQRYSAVFDHYVQNEGKVAFAFSHLAAYGITTSRVDVQVHRVVSTVSNPISETDYNKLYYGRSLSASTLDAAQKYPTATEEGTGRSIVAVYDGAAPVVINTKYFQKADTVVTESTYEEMEEAGTLDPTMRYVIIEDSDEE